MKVEVKPKWYECNIDFNFFNYDSDVIVPDELDVM